MWAHYADPKTIGVGGLVVPVWPQSRPKWFPEEFDWVVGCSYRGLPTSASPVRNPIGCNMSFRRTLFDQIGGFREGIGRAGDDATGGEETELCIRALELRPESVFMFDPRVIVHHQLERDRASWHYFRSRCMAEGRSKALVVRQVGAQRGLASERRYTTRVLPLGVARGVLGLLWGDVQGPARSGAIIAGFCYTAGCYLRAKRRRRVEQQQGPLRIVDVDLALPMPKLESAEADGRQYSGAFCLVRQSGTPVGVAEVAFGPDGLRPDELAERLTRAIPRRATPRRDPPVETPPAETPFVSVIVATRDRPASLAVCLDSLLGQDYPSFDIVVVDNAPSTHETAALISGQYAATGRVRYVREDRAGLGQAHNRGLAEVTAPIAAFTDDDVRVDSRWLSALAANFAADPGIGCVTGLILPAQLDTRAQYWTERHGGFGKGFERKIYDLQDHRPAGRLFPYTAGQFGSGANMAFRTEALKRIGGFDPALGAGTLARGGDDLAAFFKVVQGGYRLVYEPEALLWHHHRREEAGMRRQAFSYGMGLGAYLTKIVVDRPRTLLDLAMALPAGLFHMLAPSSAKNSRLPGDYPAILVWRERLGILAGIAGYIRSRAALRRPVESANRQQPRSWSTA
jgi:GT2 family glycosyltransferase